MKTKLQAKELKDGIPCGSPFCLSHVSHPCDGCGRIAGRLMFHLKTWPKYFEAIRKKRKLFECRKDDRNFQVGEYIKLVEYNPDTDTYTGREIIVEITYKIPGGSFGIEKYYCVLGIRPIL